MSKTIKARQKEPAVVAEKTALELRLSLWRAALSSLQILLTALLIVPVASLLNRLFRGTWRIDWMMLLIVPAIISAIWFLGVFVSSFADLRAEEHREQQDLPVFPANNFIRGVFVGGALLAVALSWGLYREHDHLAYQLIPFGLLLVGWFGWPRAIHFYRDSVGQRSLWGQMRRIQYKDVQYISYISADGNTVVAGPDLEIVHTGEHADKELFHSVIEEKAGKTVC